MLYNNIGLTEITRRLNQEGILTPMEYAISKGTKGNYNTGTGKWSTRTLKDMLTNITYAGHLCQGKDKITVNNTHEAIIEQSLFEEVQEILQAKYNSVSKNLAQSSDKLDNPLKGKVICGCCGGKMQRRQGSDNAGWYYFTCISNNRQGKGSCTGMHIRERVIIDKIKQDINDFILETEPKIKRMSAEKQQLRKEMFMLDMEDAKSNAVKRSYYEDFCIGKLTNEQFRAKADELIYYTDEITELDKEIKALDFLREKYNFHVKVRERQISIEEFISKNMVSTTISDKNNVVTCCL